ncbi:beta-lactamase family protein [Aquicoccus porphyridii]|uniref:Beta-lactamase family protein n=1 Tax=Aquicoccus porphyridii TaxID=1852029 RepID=A0A5A9ZKF1_9RHOB|nr:serine hydrolase domain-containing protein [Aquicoccus porphyridii]KAA0917502.1 beta-lactamase family protein [Aquicoccus porphyridii]RAI55584.1 serine hydrolase [Rhodobacteraceae bacterium AsT-22]
MLDQPVTSERVPGLVALIARESDVWTHVAGVRDLESGAPMQRDTLFAVASIGKPLTAVAALMLVQDGVLGLDEPVDRWLPELAAPRVLRQLDGELDDTLPATRAITLRDLLSQRMGLGIIFADVPLARQMQALGVAPGPTIFAEDAGTFMARLGSLPLAHQPGERWLYHTGLDVAGVLVARASGMSLGEFQRRRIFEPLGMANTGFSGRADQLATQYSPNAETGALELWNSASGGSFAQPPAFEAGGSGHVSTVDDFLAFGRFLLAGGMAGNQRLLSAELVAEMLRDQITPAQKAASPWFPPDFWDTHGWGLGVALRTAPENARGRFGWWGGFGTAFWCDPATDTVAVLFTQRMMTAPDDAAFAETFINAALDAP